MNSIRRDNREKEYYWEWFRRSQLDSILPTHHQRHLADSITRILEESNINNCLEYLCGFGSICNKINRRQPNVIGYDTSASAIRGARLNTDKSGLSTLFFLGNDKQRLAEVIPHKVSGIFSTQLLFEPNWHELKNDFSEIFETLAPGGKLIFTGASETRPFASSDIACFDKKPHEIIEWSFRDGERQCTRVFVKSEIQNDYRDYKNLYIINNREETILESTEERIPGYWNLHNIGDLAYETGFLHFEARTFKDGESEVTLNIASKPGTLTLTDRAYSEEAIYNDF